MRSTLAFKLSFLFLALASSPSAFSFSSAPIDEVSCKLPKIVEFSLPEHHEPEYLEVDSEAEFSFKISGMADPEQIKLSIKDKDLPFQKTVNSSFIMVKSKLPADLKGKYARVHVQVGTALENCRSKHGWLIKVKN